MTAVASMDGEIVYSRIYCKSWGCPRCGPIKAYWYQKRIGKLAQEHKLGRMLTLTLDPAKLPEGVCSGQRIRKIWAKFRTYVKRDHGTTLSYISAIEQTKKGLAHLHVLVDRFMAHAWISDKWSRLGGGKIVHITRAHDLEACGFYIGKYLSKEAIEFGFPGQRRITTSRDIRLRPPKGDVPWNLIQRRVDWLWANTPGAHKQKLDKDGELTGFSAPWDFGTDQEEPNEAVH